MTSGSRSPRGDFGNEPGDGRKAMSFGKYAGAGLQFAASIIVFLLIGEWVDRRFGWSPWGVIVGVFGGAAAAFVSLYSRLMADLRREEEAKRNKGET